jgi:hypothetical protein
VGSKPGINTVLSRQRNAPNDPERKSVAATPAGLTDQHSSNKMFSSRASAARTSNRRNLSFGGWFAGVLWLTTLGPAAESGPLASDLKAVTRDGQVFLTWNEAASPSGTTFNVYMAEQPISNVAQAQRVGHHIERQSAMDWWEDKASFSRNGESDRSHGYRLLATGEQLDPTSGLFVHTVAPNTRGRLYFAVTHTDAAGKEDATITAGVNTLADGFAAAPGAVQSIWQRAGLPPQPGAGKGKALWLNLHGKSGVVAESEYLAFGDATLGWREGLPFKFSVRIQGDTVVIRPTDRTWINRSHDEASDGGAPAIWTFWYGYNSNIYDRTRMGLGTPTNYTERRLLWILTWVSQHYLTDPNRWYCSGSSMGGCGTLSFGMRHPELFAACHAHVPIVSYTYLGNGSARRLEPSCWIGAISPNVKTDEGVPLLERMNGTQYVTERTADLPFLFILNGRKDESIPWENNPPFYRALSERAHGFAAYWDDGAHGTSGKNAPDDVKAWTERFRRFRLNQSFPVFVHTSSDRDVGNGDPANGDLIGWINRGMEWKDIEDESEHYAITVVADYPGVAYPVRTDMSLRRVQRFKVAPRSTLSVSVGEAPPMIVTAGADGRITVPNVVIPSARGIRVLIRRS